MSAITGFTKIGDYSTPVGFSAKIAALLALIPNPDGTPGTGSVGGGVTNFGQLNTYLDEMSPGAAVQLRVELLALQTTQASGVYAVTAGDVTATYADIVTGLADLTLANSGVTIRRAGTVVGIGVITEPVPGTIRVGTGGGWTITAADVITWFAQP